MAHNIQEPHIDKTTIQIWSSTRWRPSPILFNIYTSDIPLPPDSVQLTTYADDITITAPHRHKHRESQHTTLPTRRTQVDKRQRPTSQHIQDDMHTTHPRPSRINTQLGLQIDNTTLLITTHPKILGPTLDPKLTYNRHIDLAATKARKTINILKVGNIKCPRIIYQVGQT